MTIYTYIAYKEGQLDKTDTRPYFWRLTLNATLRLLITVGYQLAVKIQLSLFLKAF